jgi:hypothetical protein
MVLNKKGLYFAVMSFLLDQRSELSNFIHQDLIILEINYNFKRILKIKPSLYNVETIIIYQLHSVHKHEINPLEETGKHCSHSCQLGSFFSLKSEGNHSIASTFSGIASNPLLLK